MFARLKTLFVGSNLHARAHSPPLAAIEAVFDSEWYLAEYSGAVLGQLTPFEHYMQYGARCGFDPNPYFNAKWYLTTYKDVSNQNSDPLEHYILHGAKEARDPSPYFSTTDYLTRYPDVAESGQNPLQHFLEHGIFEGRSPRADVPALAILRNAELWRKIRLQVVAVTRSPSRNQREASALMTICNQIEGTEVPSEYNSTGNDPQFLIALPVPAGFFRLRLHIEYSNIPRRFSQIGLLQLFVGDEDGFRPGNVWTYIASDNELIIDDILFNEKNITSFRLDPINTRGIFRVVNIEISPIGLDVGVNEIIGLYRHKLQSGTTLPTSIYFDLTSHRLRNIVHQLSTSIVESGDPYQKWIAARIITSRERSRFTTRIEAMLVRPKFSILMPTYRSNLKYLDLALASIHNQIYPNWELCIVDDGSNQPEVNALIESWAGRDSRIRFVAQSQNAGISQATNAALDMADGLFIALVDHDDEIAPHALFAAATEINRYPDVDMIYTDEDKIDLNGNRFGPLFKPDWSPEFFLGCMYTCHLGIYRRSLVEQVGRFRSKFDLAQDYDLALRISAAARRIVHIPDVLYHWRILENSTASSADAKPEAEMAAQRAVQSALDAEGLQGMALEGPFRGSHRVKLALSSQPLISLVIPTAARRIESEGERWYLLDLIQSLQGSTYKNIEIVLVHNGDIEPLLMQALEPFEPTFILYSSPHFNISEKMNLGVKSAQGEYVVLLNDDMTIISNNWLEEMLMWFERSGVVGVGAKLLFPNNTIQHAGVLYLDQGPSHVYYSADASELGLAGSAALARNYSAVTGACLMVKKSDYISVGGFDPSYRVNYNDVDFCLRLRKLGRIVYEPNAILYHYESVSKGVAPTGELDILNAQWSDVAGLDPYYNIHLSQGSSFNEVSFYPRTLSEDYP